MRKIADSNFLGNPELETYLEKPHNEVVLPDYIAMEAYKHSATSSIQKSTTILCQYPKQVIILKDTQSICGMRGRNAGLQRRMIDTKQTRGFKGFCQDVKTAMNGNIAGKAKIIDLQKTARSNLEQVRRDAKFMAENFSRIQDIYSDEDIRRLRRNQPFSEGFIKKLLENTNWTAALMFHTHPKVQKMPNGAEVGNTLIYRFVLCVQLRILKWIANGSPTDLKLEKSVNALVDTMIVAYGTFFDGILSKDTEVQELHEEASFVLKKLFAA